MSVTLSVHAASKKNTQHSLLPLKERHLRDAPAISLGLMPGDGAAGL